MIFFRRLRASASTCSFQRAVLHSGPPGLVLEPTGVVRPGVGDEVGESRRASDVAASRGVCLVLNLGIVHLRASVFER
jgi:hypothetical protein